MLTKGKVFGNMLSLMWDFTLRSTRGVRIDIRVLLQWHWMEIRAEKDNISRKLK